MAAVSHTAKETPKARVGFSSRSKAGAGILRDLVSGHGLPDLTAKGLIGTRLQYEVDVEGLCSLPFDNVREVHGSDCRTSGTTARF